MDKSFSLLFLLLNTILTLDIHPYQPQGSIDLVQKITKLGYSPNQKHLIVLADSLPDGKFLHYHGFRLNLQQQINIVDSQVSSVKPSEFAFSKDGAWLVVGTSWGAVYGYEITDGEIQPNYKYKYAIGGGQQQDGIKSISFSVGGQIAVAAKDKLVVLKVLTNEQAQNFVQVKRLKFDDILSSVAWRSNNENIVIVGGDRDLPYFHTVDINQTQNQSVKIGNLTQKTLSIGVFPDDDETILQGKFDGDIGVYKWNDALTPPNYEYIYTINDTAQASQIRITSDGLYFAAHIKSTGKVLAWKSSIQLNTYKNLKKQDEISIVQELILNQTGSHLALSNDGNRILIITETQTVSIYSVCDQNQWYDHQTRDCKPCENSCMSCFDANNCNTCQDSTKFVDTQNICQPCSKIKKGCQNCSDNTTCTACNKNGGFDPTPDPIDNSCKCASTFFPDDNQCKECNVISFCLECESASKCTTCVKKDHIAQKPQNGICVCDAGWYLDSTCKDCTAHTGCKECKSAKECTLCDKDNKWTKDPSGKCICEPGYWQNGKSCELCSAKTTNCTVCQQDGTCTKCTDKRVVSDDKTKCVCQNHTYEDTKTKNCQFCDEKMKCLHCNPTGSHNCTECDYIDGNRKKQPVNGSCICQSGYIENAQEKCIKCSIDGCEKCDPVNVCSQCFAEKNFKPTPDNQTCVCNDGYLKKKNNQSCSTCGKQIPGCSKCDDLEVCQACDSKGNFIEKPNATNKCSCAVGYVLKDALCKVCSVQYGNCQQCNENQCTKCKASYYKNDTECKSCASQYSNCNNCSIQSGCYSCQQTFSYNSDDKTCFCPDDKQVKDDGKCEDNSGLSPLAIIAIIVGILAVAGAAVAIIKCLKKRQSPLEDGEYEALEGEKNQ